MEEGARGGPASELLQIFDGPRLSPTYRRLAQYIIAHPHEAALLSSTDLARKVGASQPSVTRFANAVGFDGYPALRRRLQALAASRADGEPPTLANKYQEAVGTEIQNLRALAAALADSGTIADVGQELARADPLIVLGLRASMPVASYFGYFARKVHPHVRVVLDGGTRALDALVEARSRSALLLCFLLPRYPAETIDAIRYAAKLGIRRLLVSDSLTPFRGEVDRVLTVQLGSRTVFDSHGAAFVLANLLVEAICDASGPRSEHRLEELERMFASEQIFLTS